ncbi:bidirectional sugar transporter SWEET1-like [Olea europaea subsp. europaea]|uniref:Bidirectional sugar transporter SWEET1-like n=1 Tax=Olea europaea subsp. europaea TaxID=158383 RepID=A0A8S0Q5P5_OLEEU|nr:bidirectional sugar transporter SWEET1-like [Olea europaea subsp. europaea]
MENILHFVIGIFGNAFALFLFLAPLITFKRIIKKRSTEEFSGIPYVMTMLNCLLSAWYGMPFVSPNNLLVSTINGTGAAIESVYVLIFLIFASKKEKGKILGLLTLILSVFAVVAFVSLFALHGKHRKLFCGIAATVFSIVMYGSPLTIIASYQNEKRGIHAILLVVIRVLMWYFLVCLWPAWKGPFCCYSQWFWQRIRNSATDFICHLPQQQRGDEETPC